jgi:hypothetical protein
MPHAEGYENLCLKTAKSGVFYYAALGIIPVMHFLFLIA